jgi:hypothetical protein
MIAMGPIIAEVTMPRPDVFLWLLEGASRRELNQWGGVY